MRASPTHRGGRPIIISTRGVVTSGHYLTTEAGIHILGSGGNAFDAGAATGFALTVLEPHQNGIGGEVPILVHVAREGGIHAISGVGGPSTSLTFRVRSGHVWLSRVWSTWRGEYRTVSGLLCRIGGIWSRSLAHGVGKMPWRRASTRTRTCSVQPPRHGATPLMPWGGEPPSGGVLCRVTIHSTK